MEVRFEDAARVRREALAREAAAAVAEREAAAAVARARASGAEDEPVIDMDPLRLLRRRRGGHDKPDRGPRMARGDGLISQMAEAPPEPQPPEEARPAADRFETIARAPLPAALLTLGYDSPTAQVASVRLDLDLRRFNLSLAPDTLREPRPRSLAASLLMDIDPDEAHQFPKYEFTALIQSSTPLRKRCRSPARERATRVRTFPPARVEPLGAGPGTLRWASSRSWARRGPARPWRGPRWPPSPRSSTAPRAPWGTGSCGRRSPWRSSRGACGSCKGK